MPAPRTLLRLCALLLPIPLALAACQDRELPTALLPGVVALSEGSLTGVRLDAATTYYTEMYGLGVTEFTAACPAGYVAVGMAGTTGNWFGFAVLTQVRLNCRELLDDGSFGASFITSAHPASPNVNMTVLVPFDESCAGGALVVVPGVVSTQVVQIGGICAGVTQILAAGPITSTKIGPWRDALGSSGTNPVAFLAGCRQGYAVTGLIGRAGAVLDAVGAICTAVVQQTSPGHTPTGEDVKVAPKDLQTGMTKEGIEITFENVESPGETTVESKSLTDADSPPAPDNHKFSADMKYYDIKTDAEFTGEVTVCIEYEAEDFPKKESVKLLHYEDKEWKDITTSNDETTSTVCGETSSFSPFLVAQELYAFTGFFRPIENLPAMNRVRAGRAVPIKFSLGGDQGSSILAGGAPAVWPIACGSLDHVNGVDEAVNAGHSSLSYDPGADQYTYVWKTSSDWANSGCRQLVLKLDDGSEHRVNFQFTP
jgi:hypothetical protein